MTPRSLALTVALAVGSVLSGCGAYELSGKVVESAESAVQVVASTDPRLSAPGLGGVMLQVTVDPKSLGRKILAPVFTAPDGSFQLGIEEFGAGTLEYQISLVGRHERFRPTFEILPLPARGRVLLVTMTRGRDHDVDPQDPLRAWRDLSAPPPKPD